MVIACGVSNSPGAEPFLPHALMNFPSFENFTMRALESPPCPSATKISPFGAVTTSHGRLKVSGPSPATPALPSVISTFPSGLNLNYLVTLAIFAGRVGRPDVAVAVDMETVRLIEHSLAKHLQDLARRIELNDRRDVRALAGASPAPLKRPDIAIAVDFDPDGRTPLPTLRELGPALFNTIRIVLRVCLRCEHRHRDDDCKKVEIPST